MKVGATLLLFLSGNALSSQVPSLPLDVDYEGHVSENGGVVRVIPEIRAENGPICGFRIVNNDWGQIPFEIFMKSPENGTAELKARHPLDCESKEKYELSIAAVACNGLISPSRPIHVIVDDDNEYIPLWSSQQYSASLEEGEMSPFIVKVEATDKDCSPQFGDVCDYAISGSHDNNFAINSQGIITNTQPLWSSDSRVHVLSVVAVDCGGKESSPVLVTINIIPSCRNVWSDVSTSMTYLPGTGPQPLFPSARLSLCPVSMCAVAHIETRLSLHTEEGDTCDRDTFTVNNQKKLCGASSNAVDLLTDQMSPQIVFDNSTDEEDDVVGDSVFKFDGQNGAVVSRSLLSHDFGTEFSVQTWMRHARKPGKQTKEQIVCLSDDHRKSRHHTALFVRNCKLVFLNRRHYDEEERNVFKPAEWRWSLPQVCDNRWHHYAVMVSQDGAQLYVDGELFDQDGDSTEIIDDWPLHPSANVDTTLTVGGCWHGHEMRMMHELTASLAGLSLLTGKREHSQVLKCIVQCSESLQLPASNLLEPGMEMVTNSHGSMVTIDGDNVNNVNTLIRQVAYLNTREFPAPGKRKVEMTTKVKCDDDSQLQVPVAMSSVMVLPMPQPIIDISGTDNMSRDYESFKQGVRVFADIKMMVSQDDADFRVYNDVDEKIDHCSISVFPPLNPDHEELHIPQNMLLSLNIGGSASVTGVEIVGTNMVYNYEQVIRQVTYTNQKPAYYLNRQFKLSCSHLNNRFVSNEFIETLTVIHPSYDADIHPNQDRVVSHQQMSRLAADLPQAHFFSQSRTYGGASSGLEQGNAVVVVVIVSMGLLITVLAVGVVKLKSVASRDLCDEADSVEMGWEDSANTNITINPLEATMSGNQICQHSDSEFDEADSDHELYEEDSDDCMDETKDRLAWDKTV